MGCGGSKPQVKKHDSRKIFSNIDFDPSVRGVGVYLPQTGPLTAKDYKERLSSSNGTQSAYLPGAGYLIRWAYVSQRGYYPDSPDKANQDAFCVQSNFTGDHEQHLFGVYDGHGEFGTACANFARDKVPENLASSAHFGSSPELAFHHAMVITNNQLHRSEVDDQMSGTTAIAVLIRGRSLCVANVGDSRAVLAERVGDKFVAVDLSIDQTPYRTDECERVRRCGARVLTLDQVEGIKDASIECWTTEEEDDGDPPRLWFPNGMYPGTAFTRSIGDSAAERIGVFAEPEVTSKQLSPSHAFLVIASDGVFEFLSSQSVVDMVSKFDDPQEACYSVVAESYRLWLQYETRTDDITMIVIQFSGLEAALQYSNSYRSVPAMQTWNQVALPTPLEAFQSSSASPTDIEHTSLEVQSFLSMQPSSSKTAEDLHNLREAVAGNFLFAYLSEELRKRVFDVMERKTVQADEVVIRQGDMGDNFYIVDSGEYAVLVDEEDGSPQEHVHTYTVTPNAPRPCFGELALLYRKPRAATVVARRPGALWQLQRRAFKAALQRVVDPAVVAILRTVEILRCLNVSQLQLMVEMLTPVLFQEGEYIVRQGEPSHDFFLLTQGEVVCTLRADGAPAGDPGKEVLRLMSGQYFGERALLSCAPRAASVIARGQVLLRRISRSTFEAAFGPLQRLIDSETVWRQRLAQEAELISQRYGPVISLLGQGRISLSDLQVRGRLYTTDYTCATAVSLPPSSGGGSQGFTLREIGISDTVARNTSSAVVRARDITRALPPSLHVPHEIATFRTPAVCAQALPTRGTCTVETLLQSGPLDETSVCYLAASLVLALEHLHHLEIIYRAVTPHTVILTETGLVQLLDFRFSKRNEGRTYTICGTPEYLSPEVIQCCGHSEAVDWWSLGVFIYQALSGGTPFAAPGDDELAIYRKTAQRVLTFPGSFSAPVRDLIDQLLVTDPTHRLGTGPGGVRRLREHPWFSGINWDGLALHQYPIPFGLRERLIRLPEPGIGDWNPQPYTGEMPPWVADF